MSARTLSLVLCVGCVGGFGLASAALGGGTEEASPPLPAVPVVVVSGDGLADGPEERFSPTHLDGAPEVMIGAFDDAVPLPVPPLVESGTDGDVVVRPATGNPYVLGFAGGDYSPPEGERIDPQLGGALARLGGDMRPDPVVYGFCMFAKRITPARIAELERLGVRNLGFHPHHSLRVAMPPEAIPTISNLDFVRWVGVARDWQKVHPALDHEYSKWDSATKVAVFISVFEDDLCAASTFVEVGGASLYDPELGVRPAPAAERAPRVWTSNGWQQKALEERGVKPTEYVPGLNVFRAEITWLTMQSLLEQDFVQFVELEPADQLHHDESVPMISADSVRAVYDGGTDTNALVGQIDSGVDIGHGMLDHVWVVGWDHSTNSTGVWNDICGHGSHVAGTMFGQPSALSGLTGVAPGLGWGNSGRVRIVKYLDFVSATGKCSGSGTSHLNLYARFRGNYNDGAVTSGAPHVINNSWGADPSGGAWIGSETNARYVDDEVHKEDQVYVFSAGNAGSASGTIGLPGCAKNVITVGSVVDFVDGSGLPGELANTSSRGSLSDNRWKPNVTAPGRWIASALAGTASSLTNKSGTSMAAPHVTGVIAQLCDGEPAFRYNPARTAAVLMATATPKNDELLTSQSAVHLDQYGAGRVNAHYALWSSADSDYSSWSFTKSSSTWSFGDFTVPPGTQRLVVVMHYIEPAAGAGASKALINDYDLWIDRSPVDTSNGNTGEYSAQQSVSDNTEIRMIDNPATGAWRWKVYPDSATQSVKMAVIVRFITDDTTPNGTLSLSASDTYVRPFDNVEVTASFFNPDVVASAVYLDSSATSTPTYISTTTTLLDGISTDLSSNLTAGVDVLLGDITDGKTRSATWTLEWPSEGVKQFAVSAKSDNADPESATVSVTVDGTDPSQASNVASSTHSANVWSNETKITHTWTSATDNLSGVAGYSHSTTVNATALPNTTLDIGAVTSLSEILASSAQGYYFNLRSVDNSGNWDNTSAAGGPYLIDAVDPSAAANLISSTHVPNAWSNDPSIGYKWNAATDTMSGLLGYSVSTTLGGPALPNASQDVGAVTSYGQTLGTSSSGYTFNLRSLDVAGNVDNTSVSTGPYFIDTVNPSSAASVQSTTHTVGAWSNAASITMGWSAASDSHSGLNGYDTVFDHAATTTPSGSLDASATATSKSYNLSSSASGWTFHIRPRDVAGNWGSPVHVGPFFIDTGAPAGPSGLQSPTHAPGVWSQQTGVTVTWAAATDGASGIAGYDTVFDHSPSTVPSGGLDASASATSKSATLQTSTSGWYFHVRAKDQAGNWGTAQHFGPILIGLCGSASANVTYGSGKPGTNGVPVLVAQDLPVLGTTSTVSIKNAYPGALPILILGANPISVPWDGGTLLASLDLMISIPVGIFPDGTLPLTGALPADPTLCGVTLYHQLLVPDPGATGFYGMAISPGLARTFGS